MLPETHPLIAAATEQLADNAKQRLAANALLEENFNPADSEISENLTRLERADAKRFPRLWTVCLHVCATLAFLLLAIPSMQIRNGLQSFRNLGGYGYSEEPKIGLPENLSSEQSLLIGDPNIPEFRQKELLHLSAPDRPDFYTEYAGSYFSENGILPDDYLAVSARIDPENSFPPYNAAAREGGDSFEKITATKTKSARYVGKTKLREIPDETVWKIKDEKKFNKGLELIAKASALPGYNTYETSLAEVRLPLFNQERMIPRIRTLGYFAGQTTQVVSIRKVAQMISAKAYFLSLSGNTADFLKLYESSEAFLAQLSRAPDSTIVSELVYTVCAMDTANAFHFGADRLGLADLAEKMELRRKAFIDDANKRSLRVDSISDRFSNEGSMLSFLTAPMLSQQVANPPQFDPASLTPGRLAEYDIFSSILLPVLAALLAIAALVAFVSKSFLPRPVKVIAKRLNLLLRPVDWAWVAVAAIAPIALTLIITRYTTLGGREYNIRHNQMVFPAVHYLLIFLLLLTVPLAVIRWRLGKRLAALGMATRFRLFYVIFPAVGSIALLFAHPVIEYYSITIQSAAIRPLALLPALWILSILIGFGSMYFGKNEQRIARASAVGALTPALSFAIILLAALVPVFRESAEKWVARDKLTRVVPVGLSYYEAEIAIQKRKETNAILGFD